MIRLFYSMIFLRAVDYGLTYILLGNPNFYEGSIFLSYLMNYYGTFLTLLYLFILWCLCVRCAYGFFINNLHNDIITTINKGLVYGSNFILLTVVLHNINLLLGGIF